MEDGEIGSGDVAEREGSESRVVLSDSWSRSGNRKGAPARPDAKRFGGPSGGGGGAVVGGRRGRVKEFERWKLVNNGFHDGIAAQVEES